MVKMDPSEHLENRRWELSNSTDQDKPHQLLGPGSFYCGIIVEDDEEVFPNFDESSRTQFTDEYASVRF